MRYLILFSFLILGIGAVHADEGAKSEGVGTVHHTPHPPHDHHETDHAKKLDEGLKRSREEQEKEDD